MESILRIEALMTSTAGDEYPVRLTLFLDGSKMGDESISKMNLTSDFVPDGEYVLEFDLGKHYHEYVRVRNGFLVSG